MDSLKGLSMQDLLKGLPQQSQQLPTPQKSQPFGMLRSQMGLDPKEQAAQMVEGIKKDGSELGIPALESTPTETIEASPMVSKVAPEVAPKEDDKFKKMMEGIAAGAKTAGDVGPVQQTQMQALNTQAPDDSMKAMREKILASLMNRG